MLETKDISYSYDEAAVLQFPDMKCAPGETLLILGNSGVGKTTILHLLAGLMRPKNGSINIAEQDLSDLSEAEMDAFRGENIGIIFQKNHFIRSLNVLENILINQQLGKKKIDKKFAESLLSELNLDHKTNSKVFDLSEGERQRVSIARALANEPKLILADEPTSALDDDNCQSVLELLQRESQKLNAALVIVTHDNRLKEKIENRIILK